MTVAHPQWRGKQQARPPLSASLTGRGAGRSERSPLHDVRDRPGFSDPVQWRFDWVDSYTRDEWLDQLPTSGGLTQLPEDSLGEVLEGVGAVIDTMGVSFTMSYATMTVTAVRTSTA
jgi:hypothetical protein